MTASAPLPPPYIGPQWAQDPYGKAALRWWDGIIWTEHVHAPHGIEPQPVWSRFNAASAKRRYVQPKPAMFSPPHPVFAAVFIVCIAAIFAGAALDNYDVSFLGAAALMFTFPVVHAAWKLPLAARTADRPMYTPTAVPAGESLFTGVLHGDDQPRTSWLTHNTVMWWSCMAAKGKGLAHPGHATEVWGDGPRSFAVVADDGSRVLFDETVWRHYLLVAAPGVRARRGGYSCVERGLVEGEQVTVLARVGIDTRGQLTASPQQDHNTLFVTGPPENAAKYASSGPRRLLLYIGAVAAVAVGVAYAGTTSGVFSPTIPWLLAVGVAASVGAVTGIWYRNRFAVLGPQLEGAWSTIETFTQRRHDLVGNLVAATTAVSQHVEQVFTDTARERSPSPEELDATGRVFTEDTTVLAARIEAYPELTTSVMYQTLAAEIVRCENQVAGARDGYNSAVAAIHRWRRHPLWGPLARRVTPDNAVYFTVSSAASGPDRRGGVQL